MKFNFEVIPHNDQRYETVGDWWLDEQGVVQVRSSRMSKDEYHQLIFVHEMNEFMLEFRLRRKYWETDEAAIKDLVKDSDSFDRHFEAKRPENDDVSEPGYATACPIYLGHMAACAAEHIAAMVLGVDYNKYQKEAMSLRKD